MKDEINKIVNWIEMGYTRLNYKEELSLVDYIKQLQQENKKYKEVIDKVRNNLEKDISVIKNVKMSNKEIICRLEETNKILKEEE